MLARALMVAGSVWLIGAAFAVAQSPTGSAVPQTAVNRARNATKTRS